jgi:hypothetical protein
METNTSESLKKSRKRRDVIKTGGESLTRDEPGGYLLTDQAVAGMKRRERGAGFCVERGNLRLRCQGRNPSGGPTRVRVPMRSLGAEQPVRA